MADAIETEGAEIGNILHATLNNISEAVKAREQDIVVDVELHFKSIYVHKSGVLKLFFSNKHKEESLEIRIATRIRSS
jgi:hypothetical protein